jgi:hypothetical protein
MKTKESNYVKAIYISKKDFSFRFYIINAGSLFKRLQQ